MKQSIMVNIVIRTLLALAAVSLFTLCFMPYLRRRILNTGNTVGMAVSLLVFLYAVFMPKVNAMIAAMWEKKTGKIFLGAIAAFLVIGIIIVIVESAFMISAANKKPPAGATVVILGCKVYDSGPSVMLRSRLDAAFEYLSDNPQSVCVLSGGQGPDEIVSEASCMYEYLMGKGIDPSRLYLESRSTSTRENLQFSKQIVDAEGLNPQLALVTNEFHEYRAFLIADGLGLEHYAVPAATPLWLFPTYYLRELFGIMYEWVF